MTSTMADYPYRAVATLKYRPPPTQGPSISFDKGSIVTVTGSADDEGDWLEGENDQGVKGVFPATFVQRVENEEAEQTESGEGSAKGENQEIEETTGGSHETTEAKEETPEPVQIEQAASSISKPTSPPSLPTSPSAALETSPEPSSKSPAPSEPAKATPPPPAKKPNALAARIAAFQQSQQSPSAPAPVPRPKPASKWTVGSTPSVPPPSTSSASASSPPPAPAPKLETAPPVETDSTGKPKEFSAEDAKESIGRGGGSLRDRIKALQGLQMDQPAPPGRPPKPWKKKVVEEEEESKPAEEEGETVVKDQEPKHDVEISKEEEEERVPEIPSFEPAESVDNEPSQSAAEPSSSTKEEESVPSEPREKPSEKPSSIDLLAAAADSTPVVMTPGSASLEIPTDPSPFIPSTDKSPVSPPSEEQAVEGEEDSEAAKKQAIAARMAGLGGQKIGSVPIAALPKKAAGPRRNPRGGAKASTPVPPPPPAEEIPVEIDQTGVGEKNQKPELVVEDTEPLEQPGSKEAEGEIVTPEEESKKEDVLASMGGASSLLQTDDDEEEEDNNKNLDDDDDFDTPAPPSRPAAPAPATPTESKPVIEDPELENGEIQVGEDEFAQQEAQVEDDEANIGEQAIETLPTPATSDPVVDDEQSESEEQETSKPPIPLNRPPVPPSFVRQVTDEPPRDEINAHRFTAEIDNPNEGSSLSAPPPPARPTHAPPIATGHETVSDEPRPSARGLDEVTETPPDSRHRSPVVIPADVAFGETQRPPVPRHPAPPGHDKVTTDAEDRIMNETEVVTPPQEAFDESTAAPELTAPSVLDLAEVRDSQPESTDLSQQALPRPARDEGVPTPVVSPQPNSPRPQSEEESEDGGDEDEEDEEEEEEDPEVARRRAIAARMAKLGGMSMRMGPMIPPVGGIPPPVKKKSKTKKAKAEEEGETAQAFEAKDLNEQVVESQSSGTVTPDHPARRFGGIPSGGFALPGIAALKPVRPPQESEDTAQEQLPDEPDRAESVEEPSQETEEEVVEHHQSEPELVPPPLPAGRPLSMPPRRSVPIPNPEPESEREEEENVVGSVPEHTEEFVEEPETNEEESEMAPPPPPARPIGGHQDSIPPPAPSMTATPASPPTRSIPTPSKRESTVSLGRSTTRSSRRSSNVPATAASMGFASPRQSLDLAFDSERVQGGGVPQGQFLAKDLDLDTQTGNAWWRAQNGFPRSLQGRQDVAVEYLSDALGSKELEVIYEDYSRTIVSISFDPEDTTETTTSISQNHFAPPGKPSLDVLLHYSASLGAQIFAAAHLKANDKSSRGGLTDKQFVDFCFSKATEPVPPIGATFGAKVYEASISSEGKKGPAFAMDDEPRVGDVVVFREVKLKQTLGSKTVGSHAAIVSGFDDKKAKLRVFEVDKNGASIDEGAYKLDDLKQGTITVYRVLGKDFL